MNREKSTLPPAPFHRGCRKVRGKRRYDHLLPLNPEAHDWAGCSFLGSEKVCYLPCLPAHDHLWLLRNLIAQSVHFKGTHREAGSQWQRKEVRPWSYFLTQPRSGTHSSSKCISPTCCKSRSSVPVQPGHTSSADKYFLSSLTEPAPSNEKLFSRKACSASEFSWLK